MKNKFQKLAAMVLGVAAIAVAMNACQDPGSDLQPGKGEAAAVCNTVYYGTSCADGGSECTVTNITTNTTWTANNVYVLRGDVRVTNGATLTINQGTLIRGDSCSRGTLTITVGSKIVAIGTASEPIIFTSADSIGRRQPMDWGGLIICGDAPINQTAPANVEGFPACVTPPTYGGSDDDDDSGTLRYVRIEFGGIPLPNVANSEKNGLTMCGVGNLTDIDHVMVARSGDDGFEWFGGTVNAHHLISYANLDDDFDTDFGYSGGVQFGIALRDPQLADISSSNGFESDNDATTGDDNTPKTSAIFSNFTLVGAFNPNMCNIGDVNALHNDGLHIRRKSAIDVHNTVIAGWKNRQVFFDATTAPVANGAVTTYNHAAVPFVTGPVCVSPASGTPWSAGTANVCASATTCTSVTNSTNGGLARVSGLKTAAWSLTSPDFVPIASSVGYTSPLLLTGTNATAFHSSFVANTQGANFFKGAMGSTTGTWDITSAWVNWIPATLSYCNDGLYDE
jgi:hypothetical protein